MPAARLVVIASIADGPGTPAGHGACRGGPPHPIAKVAMSTSLPRKPACRRVAMIDIPEPGEGGAHGFRHEEGHEAVLPLAAALARQGHAVDIYRVRTSAAQASCEDVQAGVRIHRVALLGPWPLDHHGRLSQTVMAFADAIKRTALQVWPCDVVHAWGALAGLAGLRLTAGRVLPLVWSPGAGVCQGALAGIASVLARRADAVLCRSEAQRERLVQRFGALQGRTRVVSHGCDTTQFRPRARGALRLSLGLPPDGLLVLWGQGASDVWATSGREAPPAYLPFLRALHKLPAHTVTLGDPARSHGAPLSAVGVHCLPEGWRGLRGAALRSAVCAAADVTVMPAAHWDPDHLCPRESMACGTPVLVLPAVGDEELRSLVADGAAGRMLRHAHPDALRDALRDWPQHPRAAATLDMGCLLRARTFFTWAKAAEHTFAAYEAARRPAATRDDCRPLTLVRCLPRPLGAQPAGVNA